MSKTSRRADALYRLSPVGRILMALAVLFIVAGYALMSGDGSSIQAFCPAIFSVRRIVLAPVCCLCGYLLVIVAILWRRREEA